MSQQASVVDAESVSAIVKRRCADLGVAVRFDEYAETAMTDGRTITFPALRHPITKDQLDILHGYCVHETGHHLRPDAFKIMRSAKPPEHLCAIFNIVEDESMERAQAKAWNGDAKALGIMNDLLIRKATEMWRPVFKRGEKAQTPEPTACLNISQLARQAWDTYADMACKGLMDVMPQNAKDLTNTLVNEGWKERFQATMNPHDSWDVAVDLAKRLYPGKDKEYEEIRKAGHQKTCGRDDSKDTFKDKQKKGKGKGKVDPNAEGKVVSWKDVVISEHKEWKPNKTPGNLGIDWRGAPRDASAPALMPLSMINVIDLATENPIGRQRQSWKSFLPHNEESRQLANNMRRYLQAQTKSKVYRHQLHGRLDASSIVKLALPPIERGEYNKKIFYERQSAFLKDTCVMVLTDWSGSMRGQKMKSAADASQRLVYVMERILKIPVALAAFSNGFSKCDVGVIKPFGSRGTSAEKIAERFAKFQHWTSANNDADALNWAYHQIRGRSEKRKILFVLSDGCPAGEWAGVGRVNLKYLTKHIEQEGKIELYGVGIHSDAVKGYYKNCRVLNSADQINSTLFQLIKDGDTHETRRQ